MGIGSLFFVTLLCYILFMLVSFSINIVNTFSIKDLQKSRQLMLKIASIRSRKFDRARKLSYLCSAVETRSLCAEKQARFLRMSFIGDTSRCAV